jgi:hypothetical protein
MNKHGCSCECSTSVLACRLIVRRNHACSPHIHRIIAAQLPQRGFQFLDLMGRTPPSGEISTLTVSFKRLLAANLDKTFRWKLLHFNDDTSPSHDMDLQTSSGTAPEDFCGGQRGFIQRRRRPRWKNKV